MLIFTLSYKYRQHDAVGENEQGSPIQNIIKIGPADPELCDDITFIIYLERQKICVKKILGINCALPFVL
jgi:hypothetical protein